MEMNLKTVSVLALVMRLGMLLYGEWQDRTMQVKYTDIDYSVFTDAAKYVLDGASPYSRATYRYTPLLAYMMTPNWLWFRSFGKVVFVTCDLVAGYLMHRLLTMRGMKDSTASKYASIWLLNPFVATISTRGSAESIMSVLVLLTFVWVLEKKLWRSAIVFGVAVHFKIYPVIYAIPLMGMMGDNFLEIKSTKRQKSLVGMIIHFLNPWRVKFALISFTTFLILGLMMYHVYGYQFLHETYLYHLTRKDHRHNFSVYFYSMYLIYNTTQGFWTGLLSFLPGLVTTAVVGIVLSKDLVFAAFIQTWCFVMFNKVCTSQYFIWYLTLFPPILPSLHISAKRAVLMVIAWVVPQALWLSQAFRLEHLGENTYYQVWLAGILFMVGNVWICGEFIKGWRGRGAVTGDTDKGK